MGRPKGSKLSEESKEAIRQSKLRHWAAIRELMRRAAEDGTLPEPLTDPGDESLWETSV